jgi:hypothetical protein
MGYVAWDGRTYEGTPPEGWHEASDGRWWPIGQGPAPAAAPPPPTAHAPPPPPPVGTPGPYAAPMGFAPPPAEPRQRSGCLMAGLIIGIVLAGLVVVGLVVGVGVGRGGGDEASEDAFESGDEVSPGSTFPFGSDDEFEASGDADEIDDVRSCSWAGDEILIELVNDSSKTSNYVITTAYLDEAGDRVGDEVHFINAVRTDEEVRESLIAFEEPTEACEVIDVERFAGASTAEEFAEVGPCQLGPPDFADDATGAVTATNSSSKISDYLIEVAFLDDAGVRIGHGTAIITSVRPGESAPGNVTSFSNAESITSCEVVSVTRNEAT